MKWQPICNPIPELLTHDDAPNIIHNRVTHIGSLLELPPHGILDCCFVQAVFGWAWSIEDGCDASYFQKITRVFDDSSYASN